MKMQSYELDDSNSASTLRLHSTDRMRRPVTIKITVEQGATGGVSAQMDRAELGDLLGMLATIAWNEFKWRPTALAGAVAHMIQNYRAPKAVK